MTKTKSKTAKAKGVNAAQFKKIALSFPEALEKPSYGSPAIFIAKKFFTRLRAQDNSVVFIVADIPTRDMMLELDPKTYHITDHYKDYPAVLVRMERISPEELQFMLERRWRAIAPKKLLKEIDEKAVGASNAPAKKPTAKKKKAR
jgi:hypothetical protein